MRYCNLIIYLLLLTVTKSQNLVPNPSFENYSSCPSASGQLTLSVNWINPTSIGSPDYMNSCSTAMGVPYNGFGYQYAKSGNAVSGIWCFCNTFSNIREYIQNQFTTSLTANNFYLVEYFLNRSNWSDYACNNVSCLISNTSTYTSGPNGLISANPQVSKFNNDIIIDTLNWIKVSAIYQASGGENYITIGNFKNDALTTFSYIPGVANNFCAAYYYLDDISVINITTPQWQYRDTTINLGDSVLIGPAITGLNVDWFDMTSTFIKNAPGIYVKPTLTTSYQATETFNGLAYNHTVTVTVLITKVDEYDKLQNSVKLFPNPTTNNFTISNLTESTKLKVDITDTQGKLYSTELITISNNKATIKANLTNGVYFVSITDTMSGLKTVKKLVVQK